MNEFQVLALCAASYALGFFWKFKKREDLIEAQDSHIMHLKAVLFTCLTKLRNGLKKETGNNLAMLRAVDDTIDLINEVLIALNKNK